MASIDFDNVTKAYGKDVVIKDLSLKIRDGEFTVLVGPSGCGKTTLLRMIAGIGPQTSGRVFIGGNDVTNVPPGKRGIAMVFQNYAIYPTMTVRQNVEFGLRNLKIPKAERKKIIEETAGKVGLSEYLDRKPNALSGGQRQRVALLRAMVKKPSVFLMDEPLSNLDAKLRVQMRRELIELHKKLATTFVYVTHDQVEAMSMADTIVLMRQGMIKQIASPKKIFEDPDNLYTAQFIGSPPMNICELPGSSGVMFGFRPERAIVRKSDEKSTAFFHVSGAIVTREMLGNETIYSIIDKRKNRFVIRQLTDTFRVGDEVTLEVDKNSIYFFGKDEERIRQEHSDYADCIEAMRKLL